MHLNDFKQSVGGGIFKLQTKLVISYGWYTFRIFLRLWKCNFEIVASTTQSSSKQVWWIKTAINSNKMESVCYRFVIVEFEFLNAKRRVADKLFRFKLIAVCLQTVYSQSKLSHD